MKNFLLVSFENRKTINTIVNIETMRNTTTIQVEREVKDILKKMGRKGDTYNEIIKRLIKRSEYIEFMEEQYRILNGEKEWTSIDEI